MRNDLLADIVTASGGTITDRNNRNLLLKDWLDAVQAPAANYVARLNGTDQSYQASQPVALASGDIASFKVRFVTSTGMRMALFPSAGGGSGIYIHDNGRVYCRDDSNNTVGTISIDGATASTSPLFPYDGVEHDITVTMSGAITSNSLAYDPIGNRYRLNGAIYDIEIAFATDGVLSIPLTDKNGGAVQSTSNPALTLTMIGYNEDVWEVLPEPEPINYVARLNGDDQYWQLSEEVPLITSDEITFSILANDAAQSGIAMIFSYSGSYRTLLRVDDGVFVSPFGSVTENGVEVSNIATDGEIHTYKLTMELNSSLYYIGAQFDGTNFIRHLSNPVFDIVITRPSVGVVLDLPLTNKAQGAIQLATIGNINATMVGYNEDVWEQV